MPEIKHNFTGGRMNKDLDERLIPNGEYSNAVNIQVATSEGSEVGTIQNILGNKRINDFSLELSKDAIVVSSIADEKNDKLYYFVWTPEVDYIFEYSRGDDNAIPVLVDKNKDVLRFDNNSIITGINIIDDMLFWTDNRTEPKKINIKRCKEGTANTSSHTKLVNDSQGLSVSTSEDIKEKDITVIRRAPKKPLSMKVNSARSPEKVYTGVVNISDSYAFGGSSFVTNSGAPHPSIYDFSSFSTEDGSNTFNIEITSGIVGGAVSTVGGINEDDGLTGWHKPFPNLAGGSLNNIKVGTKIVFKAFDDDGTPPGLPITDYNIKAVVEDSNVGNVSINTGATFLKVKIIAIDGNIPVGDMDFVVDLFDEEERLFEFKFPRFSYRYKFEDGEYSPFAPFTDVAFIPGSFDYHPRKGYNLGMVNRASNIELRRLVTSSTPKDVVAIDILFKDETSPNIYVVDTISPNQQSVSGGLNTWYSALGDWESGGASSPYVITEEQVQNLIPSNQLLRPWDNVPRKALAQDVTGNRIVYANYLQNYDLVTSLGNKYTPEFNVTWYSPSPNLAQTTLEENGLDRVAISSTNPESSRSIKSLREYQLGVVFTDKYGRETPVISNSTGTIKLEKELADKANRIRVMLSDFASKPEGLTHLKFYVKETSGEYYNMAMDRYYDAADGNVWLTFPSSDRNKIDIDSFLILKKGSDQDTLVVSPARYKVIAIENEAPDFIKTSRLLAAKQKHIAGTNDLFTTGAELPLIGRNSFSMDFSPWGTGPGRNLDKSNLDETLYVEFSNGSQFSNRYKVTSIAHDDDDAVAGITSRYSIQLEDFLREDVNFISNDPTGATSSVIEDGAIVNIYKYKVENKPQFDGRFFVKIYEDEVFASNIGDTFLEGLRYRVVDSKKVYSMKNFDRHKELHYTDTGMMLTGGVGVATANLKSSVPTLLNPTTVQLAGVDQVFDYWGSNAPINTSSEMYEKLNKGYYAVDEFASMATYFRKMRKGESRFSINYTSSGFGTGAPLDGTATNDRDDVRHLQPGTLANHYVEYPENEYWTDDNNWADEYGKDSQPGYTARWDPRELPEPYPGSDERRALVEVRTQSADNPIHTDVWFIDAGPAKAKRDTDDTLIFEYLTPNPLGPQIIPPRSHHYYPETGYTDVTINPEGYANQNGITTSTNYWNMQLGYGGVKSTLDSLIVPDHFNVGDWHTPTGMAQNSYYASNPKNNKFIKNIESSSQFKWKEDPTGTVYTMGATINKRNRLRHSPRRTGYVAAEGGQYDRAFFPGSFSGGGSAMADSLSFNYTTGFQCNSIVPALAWDPMVDGRITNGFEIRLNSYSLATNSANGTSLSDDLAIYTDSLTGANSGPGDPTATIHVGMALWMYTKEDAGSTEDTVTNNLSTAIEFLVVREIIKIPGGYKLKLGGYRKPLLAADHNALTNSLIRPLQGTELVFVQVGMNGYSHNSEFNINTIGVEKANLGCVAAVGYNLDFVEYIEPEGVLSENPAIWETEPKDTKDLDIYYEASPTIPIVIDETNIHDAIPIGSIIIGSGGRNDLVVDYDGDRIIIANGATSGVAGDFTSNYPGSTAQVVRPSGLTFNMTFGATSEITVGGAVHGVVSLDPNLYDASFLLPWYNCYSFGNGVESNRIRDNFNLPYITNGVRVSTTLEEDYKEERRKYGLIYSGIYNSSGGINNLNQFIAAEKITKDINPIYGSIQKLHSRDSDLVTLCEDKCLRILANKNAVYNADGNPQLVATENVLGQTIPFTGEYGISKNPESFASESYRAYFTDKVRGAVMRLSKDGLTPISNSGMRDWFKDNLKLNETLLGSYDDKKDEYNLTLPKKLSATVRVLGRSKNKSQYVPYSIFATNTSIANQLQIGSLVDITGAPVGTLVVGKQNLGGGEWEIKVSNNFDVSLLGSYSNYGGINSGTVAWGVRLLLQSGEAQTISFQEKTKGWVSFKSFVPENALSMGNDYYTFKIGQPWIHHDETVSRNTFYKIPHPSSVEVVLNDMPSSIKDFQTLNYEGSQSAVKKFISTEKTLPFQAATTYSDQDIYNLYAKEGWFVDNIYTDKEEGRIHTFIEKEGKWFNNISRYTDVDKKIADTSDFTFQGIGSVDFTF